MSDAGQLPHGTLTFLRSDIEGSMRLTRTLGDRYDELNATHQGLVRTAIEAHGGREVRTEGDAFFVVFEDAVAAVAAAADIQRAIAGHAWPTEAPISLRIGLHAGRAYLAGDDYGGFEVSRAARIAAVGWGGQIVLSDPVRALVAGALPEGCAVRDLGSHRLKDVVEPEHLFQLDVEGLRSDFPSLRTAVERADHLPARTTSFVGRDTELETLSGLLEVSRLVTLTGPGGTGKTSLALELVRRHAPAFADGAWFVDLQSVLDPALVLAVVARSLGLYDGVTGPATDRLAGYLEPRTTLLLLDNFEQVIEAAPDVARLMATAPGLRVVVTSRAALRIGPEQEYAVRPLALPGASHAGGSGDAGGSAADSVDSGGAPDSADSGAVRLFIERARSARSGLAIGAGERATIGRICGLLDGLPLAIELAAARVSALPLSLIEDRLAAHLPLPGVAPRDLPERQRTLERTIAWSEDLLEPPVRQLLARIAVFEGGFDLEQAELICGPTETAGSDVLGGLVTLVEQSLLLRDDSSVSDVRFRALETIRAHGMTRLRESGEEAALRARHAEAYAALAERAAVHLPGADQARWLERLALDQANLRAALAWSIESDSVDLALRLVAASWRFWQLTGRLDDGRMLTERALALPGADAPSGYRLGALDAAGGLAYWGADGARANAFYQAQLEVARQLGDPAGIAAAAYNAAHTLFVGGDPAAAIETAALARQTYAELGDELGLAHLEWAGATVIMLREAPERAYAAMLAVLRRFEALGDLPYVALTAGGLAMISGRRGDNVEAMAWGLRAIETMYVLRDVAGATITLLNVAVVCLGLGRADACASLIGAFEALCEQYGVRPPMGLKEIWDADDPASAARGMLGDAGYEAAFVRGGRMSLGEAVALVAAVAAELGIEPAR